MHWQMCTEKGTLGIFVKMYTSLCTTENKTEIPQDIKVIVTIQPSIPTTGDVAKGNVIMMLTEYICFLLYYITTHRSQTMK